MKLLFNYVRENKKILFGALLLASVNQFFSLLDPQIFRLIVDRYASKADTYSHSDFIKGVLFLLFLSVLVAFISRVAKNFQDYFVNIITQRVGTKLYGESVSHAFSLPYFVFEDQRSGELLQKMQKARTDSQALITGFINTIFLSFIGIVFVLIYAFTVHWLIGLVYFLIIPVLGSVTFFLSRRIKEAQKKIIFESAELAGSTTETLRNVELVKSLGLEAQEIKRLNDVNDRILQLELKKIRLIRTLSFLQGTVVNTLRSLLLFLMLWLIFNKNITIGQFFSLFVYSFFIFYPLTDLGTVSSQYQEAKASMEALEKILDIKPEEKSANAISLDKISSINFQHVNFSYGENKEPSINNISFSMKSGQSIAFVGPSGSGKSTIIKLLVGLYSPSDGNIFINDIDSKSVDYDHIRKFTGYVSQETQLFAGTIRENLLFVNPDATDEECMAVIQQASISEIIQRGGKGLYTRIGESGIKLSGGERQRLAIARALLRTPELIIFDEATSSLDSITEKSITATIWDILKVRPDLMTVLVAHRLSTVSHADRIYVLEKGKIVEEGTHNELLKKGGLYGALWREQSGSSMELGDSIKSYEETLKNYKKSEE